MSFGFRQPYLSNKSPESYNCFKKSLIILKTTTGFNKERPLQALTQTRGAMENPTNTSKEAVDVMMIY